MTAMGHPPSLMAPNKTAMHLADDGIAGPTGIKSRADLGGG